MKTGSLTPFALALFLSLAAPLAGCGGDADRAGNAGDTSSTGAAPAEGDGGIAADEKRIYTFHGTPKEIDSANSMVIIDHERIGDFMDAMTMPFKVSEPALLGKIEIGKRQLFTLEVENNRTRITEVQAEK